MNTETKRHIEGKWYKILSAVDYGKNVLTTNTKFLAQPSPSDSATG